MSDLLQNSTSLPKIGDPAPDFTAQTTKGTFKFSEWRADKWTIFFSHPADFTPVCTTELIEFARESEWFAARNTQLIGLSIDSIHAHLAWVLNVKEKTGVLLDFPLIADLDGSVANAYGMLHPGASSTATVRAVFIIDPKGIVRLLIYYPLNIGRGIEEIKRVLEALQTADQYSVALPVNWQKGENVVVPAPKTLAEIEKNEAAGYEERIDFYLQKRSL
jgi:peroxiredoxin (alkyl hydroperoxide reductase subunit C)